MPRSLWTNEELGRGSQEAGEAVEEGGTRGSWRQGSFRHSPPQPGPGGSWSGLLGEGGLCALVHPNTGCRDADLGGPKFPMPLMWAAHGRRGAAQAGWHEQGAGIWRWASLSRACCGLSAVRCLPVRIHCRLTDLNTFVVFWLLQLFFHTYPHTCQARVVGSAGLQFLQPSR